MVQHGVAKSDEQVVIQQGIECRRPSEMHVRATREGGRVTDVRVVGYAVGNIARNRRAVSNRRYRVTQGEH